MRITVILSIASISLGYQLSAQNIAQWRGPQRNGHFPDTELLKSWPETGPELVYSTEGIGKGFSSAVMDKGVLYVTGMKDTLDYLTAIDKDGNIKWQVAYGLSWENSFPDTRCTPTVEDDRIYVISGMGEVGCFSTSGEQIWKVDVGKEFETKMHIWGVSESPLVIDDMVICTPAGKKASLIALNKLDGSLIWSSQPVQGQKSYASPVLFEYKKISLILSQTSTNLFAVNPENGNLEWSFGFAKVIPEEDEEDEFEEEYVEQDEEEEEEYLEEDEEEEEVEVEVEEEEEEEEEGWIITNTPVFYKDEIFINHGYDIPAVMLQVAEDGKSYSVKFIDHTFDNHHHGVVLVDGYLYGSNWYNNSKGRWVCMKWSTGEIKYVDEWNTKGSIITADGLLYVYEERGNVGLVKPDRDGFDVISSFRVRQGRGPHWAHLSIYERKLLVRHGDVMMVYDISL